MEELVQARSLQNEVCTDASAKSTFCLATPPEQGSVLLCNGRTSAYGKLGGGGVPRMIDPAAPRHSAASRTSSQ